MTHDPRSRTSVALDAEALGRALDRFKVSAVAEAKQQTWIAENADGLAAQADWHERNGHPLADIIAAPGGSSWNG